ncbi:hypothetical protein JNJ66_01375 [Candidatus Saccharibacteria bacterium]|nr:hypothetical protein [Candidatus Saccharibacteria bacterium]
MISHKKKTASKTPHKTAGGAFPARELLVGIAAILVVSAAAMAYAIGQAQDQTEPAGEAIIDVGNGQTHDGSQSVKKPADGDLTQLSQVSMDIKDDGYSLPDITIKQGTTVTWTNVGTPGHNVMQEHGGDGHAHDAPVLSEVRPYILAGAALGKGETYSFTFEETGTFRYHSADNHALQGVVTVVE